MSGTKKKEIRRTLSQGPCVSLTEDILFMMTLSVLSTVLVTTAQSCIKTDGDFGTTVISTLEWVHDRTTLC